MVNSSKIYIILIHFLRKTMSERPTQKQQPQSLIYAHYSLNEDDVIQALTYLLYVMNFYKGDLSKIYNTVKDKMFYGIFSILFGDIGPFGTFQKFNEFFENASMHGLLRCDVEVFHDGIFEFSCGTLSNAQIEELISKIKITGCISLHEVFYGIIPTVGGSIDGASLYKNPSLKRFAGGHCNKILRTTIEGVLSEFGVEIQKTPHMIIVFPENWMKEHFSHFIKRLVENLGFSEIEYVAESSSSIVESFLPMIQLKNIVFNTLVNFFKSHANFKLILFNTDPFAKLCGVEKISIMNKKKISFFLFMKFFFTIEKDVATPHQRFHEHIDHFVVAFMKLIGACVNGIDIQAVIKSGHNYVKDKTKKMIVCSSVATGQTCRSIQRCSFLHSKTTDYGLITSHTGNVMVVCRETQTFDKTPSQKNIFKSKFFKEGIVSLESSDAVSCNDMSSSSNTCAVARGGGCSAKPETRAVARGGGCSAKPETRAVAHGGGCSAKPETLAVARGGGCSAKPETRAVAGGGECSAKPETLAVAGGGECSAKPETLAVAGGCSAKPETLAVAGGCSAIPKHKAEASLKPPQPPHESEDDGKHGSETDRIMRQFRTLTDPTDMAQLTAFVVRNRQNK